MQTTPWKRMIARRAVEARNIDDANHTFSTANWRDAVADATVEWIDRHFRGQGQGATSPAACDPVA
jgi:hypothetical protein